MDEKKDKGLQGNEKIETAIAALQQEASEEMLAHTLTVIRRRMKEGGQFIVAVEPPTGKEHEGSAPSYSAAGESHLHPGKQVCRLYKNSMVQVLCICRSPAAQAGRA